MFLDDDAQDLFEKSSFCSTEREIEKKPPAALYYTAAVSYGRLHLCDVCPVAARCSDCSAQASCTMSCAVIANRHDMLLAIGISDK